MKNSTTSERRVAFVDTSAWVALGDTREPGHARVRELVADFERPGGLVTTDYVLDETITRVFARQRYDGAREFVESLFHASKLGLLRIETIGAIAFEAAWKLRVRFQDKPRISFTDLTSFVVIEKLSIPFVLTSDAHFGQVGLRCSILTALASEK